MIFAVDWALKNIIIYQSGYGYSSRKSSATVTQSSYKYMLGLFVVS